MCKKKEARPLPGRAGVVRRLSERRFPQWFIAEAVELLDPFGWLAPAWRFQTG